MLQLEKKVSLFSIGIMCLCLSCNRETPVNYLNVENTQKKSIAYASIEIDSLYLDSINTSFLGDVYVNNEHIYFLDSRFCFLNKFNSKGGFIDSYIGQGSGKNQLPVKDITFFTFLPDGGAFFMGPGYDCFIFNEKFEKTDDYGVNWSPSLTYEALLKKPEPSLPEMYSFMYGAKMRAKGDDLIFPIASQHKAFNPTMPNYSKEARILGDMSLKNGYIKRVYGRYSPMFMKDFDAMVFGIPLFDVISGNENVVTFAADSLIYLVDNNFKIKKSFGYPGKNMKKEYRNVTDPELFHSNYIEQSIKNGSYTYIEYMEKKELLFRGYSKGDTEVYDGMQIYRNEILIADLDVPKGFKIAGEIADIFYSKAFVDEEMQKIKVYKFKL